MTKDCLPEQPQETVAHSCTALEVIGVKRFHTILVKLDSLKPSKGILHEAFVAYKEVVGIG